MVEVNKIYDIDVPGQRFGAEFVVQLAFEGGAHDEDLKRPTDEFPLDEHGRPTFRPSAAWYMGQVDFNNDMSHQKISAAIITSGNDLVMMIRFSGTFSETMELSHFPCDVQDLTMSLCFNLRTKGMLPLRIVLARDVTAHVLPSAIDANANTWAVHHEVDLVPGVVGSTEDRQFPTLEIRALAGRYPKFILLNVGLPCFFFVPLTMLQFAIPRGNIGDRVGVSFAIVLTTIAHKFTMVSMVPDISYMTFLDKYMLGCFLLVILITFQGAMLGSIENVYCRTMAVWGVVEPADNATWEVGRRRLASKAGSASAGGAFVDMAVVAEATTFMDLRNCPAQGPGTALIRPFTTFDWLDIAFAISDVFWFLVLNLWAVARYMQTRRTFGARLELIRQHRRDAAKRRQRLSSHELPPNLSKSRRKLSSKGIVMSTEFREGTGALDTSEHSQFTAGSQFTVECEESAGGVDGAHGVKSSQLVEALIAATDPEDAAPTVHQGYSNNKAVEPYPTSHVKSRSRIVKSLSAPRVLSNNT